MKDEKQKKKKKKKKKNLLLLAKISDATAELWFIFQNKAENN